MGIVSAVSCKNNLVTLHMDMYQKYRCQKFPLIVNFLGLGSDGCGEAADPAWICHCPEGLEHRSPVDLTELTNSLDTTMT